MNPSILQRFHTLRTSALIGLAAAVGTFACSSVETNADTTQDAIEAGTMDPAPEDPALGSDSGAPDSSVSDSSVAPTDAMVPAPTTVGSLDLSFGTNGIRLRAAGTYKYGVRALSAPNGQFFRCVNDIYLSSGDKDETFTKYLANGQVDTSFGTSGSSTFVNAGTPYVRSVHRLPDGKYLYVGVQLVSPGSRNEAFLMKVNADLRTLDTSFGTGGTVRFSGAASMPIHTYVTHSTVQPDGKILVVGGLATPGFQPTTQAAYVVRFRSDGAVDTSFAGSGWFRQDYTAPAAGDPESGVRSFGNVALLSNQTIAVVRIGTNGTDVIALGVNGQRLPWTSPATELASFVARPGGGFVVLTEGARVLGYMNDGAVDPAYVVGDLSPHSASTSPKLYVQPDGSVYFAGGVRGVATLLLARFKPLGGIDASFAQSGILSIPLGDVGSTPSASPSDVTVLTDGKLLVTGYANDDDFMVKIK
jgi:uncharacterized delta-60 repeat protein